MPLVGDRSLALVGTLKSLCEYSKTIVANLPPRWHGSMAKGDRIFTDGVWEQGNATAVAVIVDGGDRRAHSILVPDTLVSHWGKRLAIR